MAAEPQPAEVPLPFPRRSRADFRHHGQHALELLESHGPGTCLANRRHIELDFSGQQPFAVRPIERYAEVP